MDSPETGDREEARRERAAQEREVAGAPPGLVPPRESSMLRRGFAGSDATAVAHFYRGEMNRLTVWRSRMDATTNWAILSTIGLLSLSLQHPQADSLLLVNLATLWVLLVMEARRYRFYDVWRWRVRILEAHIFAPIISNLDRAPQGPWRNDLTADLLYPTFKISMAEAMGRRLLRNFYYLFLLVLAVSLGNVFGLSPQTGSWKWMERGQALASLRQHWLFLVLLFLAYAPLVRLAMIGWRNRKMAVELHDPGGRRPYRV